MIDLQKTVCMCMRAHVRVITVQQVDLRNRAQATMSRLASAAGVSDETCIINWTLLPMEASSSDVDALGGRWVGTKTWK